MSDNKCPRCKRCLLTSDSCDKTYYGHPSHPVLAVPFSGPEERCPDCNVKQGGFHHPDCVDEKCLICGLTIVEDCTCWK